MTPPPDTAGLRAAARTIVDAGIAAVDARVAVRRALGVHDGALKFGARRRPLDHPGRIVVLGAGKAAHGMARAVEEVLGDRLDAGLVIAPHLPAGAPTLEPLRRIEVVRAAHPLPDDHGATATQRLLRIAGELTANDLCLVLLSGGASSLLVAPADGLTLDDLAETSAALLASGADIHDINTLRRHLSAVAGGWLAAVLHPCPSWSLLISDVVGDDPSVIASGPTSPDPTTFAHAWAVVERYALHATLPPAVLQRLTAGRDGSVDDTPKPGLPWFDHAAVEVIATVEDAVRAALDTATRLGFHAIRGSVHTQGEAAVVGEQLSDRALRLLRGSRRPVAVIAGGETTVTAPGPGLGGRNQELAASAAQRIAGYAGMALFSVGTDGVDGPTPAAGAIVDGGTASRARVAGLPLPAALAAHDTHRALVATGDALLLGPTGTNVMDLMGCVVWGAAQSEPT